MKAVKGIFIILLFLVLGNVVSMLLNHFIPGSVCGMVLLFIALVARLVKPDDIRTAADFLTKNMSIFFIPASIGIMEEWGLISINLLGWLGVVFISTICVLVVTGLVEDDLIKSINKHKKVKGND